jgi:hypothetical protein
VRSTTEQDNANAKSRANHHVFFPELSAFLTKGDVGRKRKMQNDAKYVF